jgi:putative spermidine/putrescine transport system substrate-binding protein
MRSLIRVLTLPLALCLLAAAPDAPPPILPLVAAGPAKDLVRKILLKPYAEATGTALADPAWDGSQEALKALSVAHGADIALLDAPSLAAACRAQIVLKLDWSGLGRDRFLPMAASDCGAGAFVSSTVLAWDRDKLQGAPDGVPTWSDFWDVAKHPGRRGLRRGARGNLEIALMADGVAPGDVYRTLRTAQGVDRAFRKLDQLRPYILWWDQPSQPAQLLMTAKVLMTSLPSGFIPAASRTPGGHPAPIGVQWSGSLQEATSWAILSNAQHVPACLVAIVIATDPARQAEFAKATALGPATRPALALLPPDAQAASPSLGAHLAAGLTIDEGFWLDNAARLDARFAAWIGK